MNPGNRRESDVHCLIHTGSSMEPTLREHDVLHVVPYKSRPVRQGDVTSFISLANGHIITHRVASVEKGGLRTKGDNTTTVDTRVVDPRDIIGIVDSVERGGRVLQVRGGTAGRVAAMKRGAWLHTRRAIIRLLRPLIWVADRTGIPKRLFSRFVDTRIFCFPHPEGNELKLFLGRREIGRLAPGKSDWHIKGLYRVFVDSGRLPTGA